MHTPEFGEGRRQMEFSLQEKGGRRQERQMAQVCTDTPRACPVLHFYTCAHLRYAQACVCWEPAPESGVSGSPWALLHGHQKWWTVHVGVSGNQNHCWWNWKAIQPIWNIVWKFLITWHMHSFYELLILLLLYLARRNETLCTPKIHEGFWWLYA